MSAAQPEQPSRRAATIIVRIAPEGDAWLVACSLRHGDAPRAIDMPPLHEVSMDTAMRAVRRLIDDFAGESQEDRARREDYERSRRAHATRRAPYHTGLIGPH